MNGSGNSSLTLHKQYRGVTDKNCLYWCHGTEGLKHQKVRKFRYPLYKYAHASYRIVSCVCLNCNMQFYGDLAAGVPLSIPIVRHDDYFADEIPVRVGGRKLGLRGEIMKPFRRITQEMLTDQTRLFIELVQ